jgi:hypothetical protein
VFFTRHTPIISPTDGRRYRAAPGILSGQFEEETFLLNRNTGRYYKLDDVGGAMWSLLRRPLSVPEIVGALCQDYDVNPSELATGVTDLLTALVDYKVVEISDS